MRIVNGLVYVPVGPKIPRRRQKHLVRYANQDEILRDRLQFDTRMAERIAARFAPRPESAVAIERVMKVLAIHRRFEMPDGKTLHTWTETDPPPPPITG